MASPSFDSAGSGSATSGTTVSWTHTLASGSGNQRVMIIYTSSQGGTDTKNANNVTVNGVGATEQTHVDSSADNLGVEQWYILDTDLPASAGGYTVEVTFANTLNRAVCGSVCYTGAEQVAPQTVQSAEVSSTSITDSITTDENDETIVGFVAHLESEVHTPDTGQTERFDTDSGDGLAAAAGDEAIAVAGAESMGWSWSTSARALSLLTSLNSGAIDETGKAITVTGSVTETNTQDMAETAKSMTAVGVISETDFKVQFETGLSLTAVGVLSETDTYIHKETGSAITAVGVLSVTDARVFSETGKSITIVGVVNSYLGRFTPVLKGGGTFTETTPNNSGFTEV